MYMLLIRKYELLCEAQRASQKMNCQRSLRQTLLSDFEPDSCDDENRDKTATGKTQ